MQVILNIIVMALLMVGSNLDIKYHRIPNVIPAAIFAVGICRVLIDAELTFFSAVIGMLLPLLLFCVTEKAGKENVIGGGDYKLFMAAGAFFGCPDILVMMFIAFTAALIFVTVRKKKAIPLCPFALLGTIFAIL